MDTVVEPARKALRLLILFVVALAWSRAAWAVEFAHGDATLEVYWFKGGLVVEAYPLPNEGYIQMARRLMAEPEVVAFNRNRPVRRGKAVAFPIALLRAELRGAALQALYPDDEMTERGWAHRVTDPLETLIQLTEAYTGSKARFRQLARYNGLSDADVLRIGTEIVVPLEWIPDELGLRPMAVKPPLALERDAENGRLFATYALKPNETLYSLLIRFTDRERAAEIRRMSGILLELNHLTRSSRVPAGRPLRIPIEWISEDYLVHKPRRAAPTGPRPAPPPVPPPKTALAGAPVHVIVDPGHGGRDVGAVYGSSRRGDRVYEHEVVYDIALRLMALLEAQGVNVHPTVRNLHQPEPVERLPLRNPGRAEVLVNPPYRIGRASVGVNLRVFLVDTLFRKLRAEGVPEENIVLVSIHGDALAPTLRGAMVYFPDYRLRAREFHPRGRVYRIRQEAVPAAIRFNQADIRGLQETSRAFAEHLVAGLRSQGVRISGRKPLRGYYYRNGQRTLPGILRYSRIPNSVLLEVANLNNPHDRRALLEGRTRQRIAAGIAEAVQRLRDEHRGEALARHGG